MNDKGWSHDTDGKLHEEGDSNPRSSLPDPAVDFGFHERERLERDNPFKIISDFDELIPAIESISNN